MSDIMQQTAALRAQLRAWAAAPDWDFLVRYEIKPQRFWEKVWWCLHMGPGRMLRKLGLSRHFYEEQQWDVRLKHAPKADDATILLLWNDITDKAEAHEACCRAHDLLEAKEHFVPVLVTEHADFAFYSRLGWLVEYLPDLRGNEDSAPSYRETKKRFLAWRYRNAVAVPLSAAMRDAAAFWQAVELKDN